MISWRFCGVCRQFTLLPVRLTTACAPSRRPAHSPIVRPSHCTCRAQLDAEEGARPRMTTSEPLPRSPAASDCPRKPLPPARMTRPLMDGDQQESLAENGAPRHCTSGAPRSHDKLGGEKTAHPEAERAKKTVSPTRQTSKEKPRHRRHENHGHPPNERASRRGVLRVADSLPV